MSDSHLRRLHELNREYPAVDRSTLYREYHLQRFGMLNSEDEIPQLLFHIVPESALDGSRLVDITELEELPVPATCRPSFRPDRLFEYADPTWNHIVARYENRKDLSSVATLYDTGIYEARGSGVCYPTGHSYDCDYAVSSQDLELSLVTVLQFYRDVLPDEHSEKVYAILSGTNLTNATIDQHRQVDRVEPFPEPNRISRLTPLSLSDEDGIRDQLTPLFRPLSNSQFGYHPGFYYDDDGAWELDEHLE